MVMKSLTVYYIRPLIVDMLLPLLKPNPVPAMPAPPAPTTDPRLHMRPGAKPHHQIGYGRNYR